MSTKRSYLSKVVVEMPDSGIKDFFDIANTMVFAISKKSLIPESGISTTTFDR